jgi:uncharacterized protein YbjQ (UPF0145 family)
MPENYKTCPSCNSEIKTGLFNGNAIVDTPEKTALINRFTDNKAPVFCNRCIAANWDTAKTNLEKQLNDSRANYQQLIQHIPIITLQVPLNWDYIVVKMLTSQSVTGTGVVSEITSSFSDFFGMQSGSLNQKLKKGETICALQLRAEAVECGANAIIGTDIDYAEVGGDKGMLMVCMTGTAIRLKNLEVMESDFADKVNELTKTIATVKELKQYETAFTQ